MSSSAEYEVFTPEEHMRSKGMWGGAQERTNIKGLEGINNRGEIISIKSPHAPVLLKCIDEGLVNASDHKKEHEKSRTKKVTEISLEFDGAQFTIFNNGPGIPITEHKKATKLRGRKTYLPEVAFSILFAGTNMTKEADNVKGGINGIGAKLINCNSEYFRVETLCKGKKYIQEFGKRMNVINLPIIEEVPKSSEEYTRVTFLPAYEEIGYPNRLSEKDTGDIDAWCRWRMCMLAAYVGPTVHTTYNGEEIATTNAHALAALYAPEDSFIVECTAKNKQYPWDIAIVTSDKLTKFNAKTIINGVCCNAGNHITFFKRQINEKVSKLVGKIIKSNEKTSVTETCKNIFLVVIGALPGADWGGQSKQDLQVSESKLTPYKITTKCLQPLAEIIAERIVSKVEKPKSKKKLEIDKYTRARRSGTKDKHTCYLLAAEGDSAITLLRSGLTLNKTGGGPSFDNYGIISLGGVIMNAMKKVTTIETVAEESKIVRSEKLKNNKTLTAIADVLGLDFNCKYSRPVEIRQLNYGGLIICTDQDLDGTGKILPLVLVWFHLFWPNLIASGYVKRFMTPVIRAYPSSTRGGRKKVPPLEFYYENEFEKWVEEMGGNGVVSREYRIKYYKGLATHDHKEVKMMFDKFNELVYTFTLDDSSAELFNIYFGTNPDLRKIALSTPVEYLTYEEAQEIHKSRLISCNTQLEVDTKAYKLDDLERKLPGIYDGIPVARRKVLMGLILRLAHDNRESKIFQLAGDIAKLMSYHHGNTSLENVIIGMAQDFAGGLNFPYLEGIGQFGSRHEGGKDAGSARYISARLNSKYTLGMFPQEDNYLLEYVFEDGERAQPTHMVPILPVTMFESSEIPSEGWRHKSIARDYRDVVNLMMGYFDDPLVYEIAEYYEIHRSASNSVCAAATHPRWHEFTTKYPLHISVDKYGRHLGGTPDEIREQLIREVRGEAYSYGYYEYNEKENTIYVSELPINKTTSSFLKKLKGKALIDDIADYSGRDTIDIRIKLTPGAMEEMSNCGDQYSDCVENYLGLKQSLKPYLNYFKNGAVIELKDYYSLFFEWVPERRKLYKERLERKKIILELKILMEEQTIKYINCSKELDISSIEDDDEADRVLEENGFYRLNANIIRSPQYEKTDNIKFLALEGSNISYKYLDLRERELLITARNKRIAVVEKLCEELGHIEAALIEKPFAGMTIWRNEVEKIISIMHEVSRTWSLG